MPIQIKIEDKTHALRRLAEELSDKNITVANVRGINKAISKSKTQYRREIVKNYNVTYADTKPMVKPHKASYTNPEGTISGSKKPISLSRFNPSFKIKGGIMSITAFKDKESGERKLRQKTKSKKKNVRGGGVDFEVKRGHKVNLPFAFMLDSDKGPGFRKQVWARGKYAGNDIVLGNFPPPGNSKSRTAITALKTTSPFGMLTKHDISEEVKKGASETLVKEFERQVNLLLKKAGAK